MEKQSKNVNRQFILLWSGQAVSMLTSAILQMAIVWYLTEKTGSAGILSIATLMGFLPQAILGVFIGALIDRYPKKKILICSDLFIALMGVVLFVCGIFGEIPIWIIMVVLFVRSIGNAFYSPALNSVMPLIVPKEELTRFAGYAQSFKSVSMLLSPAIAAVLFSIWDLNIIVLLDVLGALLAVTLLGCAKIPEQSGKAEKETQKHLLIEVKEGFEALKKEPGLTELLVISSLYAIIYFPIGTLFPHITMVYFQGNVAQSGTVEVIFAAGMLIGSLMLGLVGNKLDKMKAISASILLYGISILSIGLLPPSGMKPFFVLAGVIGISNPFFMGVQTAVYQTKVSDEFLGRILSLNGSISMMAMPIGLILSGLFCDKIGVNRWYMISGVLTLLLAVVSRMIPNLRKCCDEGNK